MDVVIRESCVTLGSSDSDHSGGLVLGCLFLVLLLAFVFWFSRFLLGRQRARICKGLVAAGATEVDDRNKIAKGNLEGHELRYIAFAGYKGRGGTTSVWCSVPEIAPRSTFYVRVGSANLTPYEQATAPIPSGDPGFDAVYQARGHSTEWVRELLADADLRRAIASVLGQTARLSLDNSDLAIRLAENRGQPEQVAALVTAVVSLAARVTAHCLQPIAAATPVQ